MSDTLRKNYDRMLDEHRHIAAALWQLTAAAKSEKKPRQAEFEALMLHAQMKNRSCTRQRWWSAIISSSGPRLIVHDQPFVRTASQEHGGASPNGEQVDSNSAK